MILQKYKKQIDVKFKNGKNISVIKMYFNVQAENKTDALIMIEKLLQKESLKFTNIIEIEKHELLEDGLIEDFRKKINIKIIEMISI